MPLAETVAKAIAKSRTAKTLFKELEEKGLPSIFRWESDPKGLLKTGFRKATFLVEGEPAGMYWGESPKEAQILRFGDPSTFGESRVPKGFSLIEAKILPEAKVKKFDLPEFKELNKEALLKTREQYGDYPGIDISERLTAELGARGDIIFAPDLYQDPTLNQVIQLRKDKVVAKIGNKYRILGLAGALGGAGIAGEGLLGPEEAEAMPKIPASVRKEIIEKLLTSPERKALYKTAAASIERIVKDPSVRRAYLGGSFASKKSVPSDIDLIVRHKGFDVPETQAFEKKFWPYIVKPFEEGRGKEGIHLLQTFPPQEEYPGLGMAAMKEARDAAKRLYGERYKWIRIAGLTGALGGAGMVGEELLGPEEAEAGPYGKIAKGFVKAVKRPISETAEVLKGKTLWDKTVKDVVKGKGDWRYIQFTDGTERAITKDVARELVQEVGTVVKTGELVGKEPASKLLQAAKSLDYHKARQAPFTTKRTQEEWLRVRQAHAKSMGIEPSPYVYVDSEKIFMPQEYAEILEASGAVKIKKGK